MFDHADIVDSISFLDPIKISPISAYTSNCYMTFTLCSRCRLIRLKIQYVLNDKELINLRFKIIKFIVNILAKLLRGLQRQSSAHTNQRKKNPTWGQARKEHETDERELEQHETWKTHDGKHAHAEPDRHTTERRTHREHNLYLTERATHIEHDTHMTIRWGYEEHDTHASGIRPLRVVAGSPHELIKG